MHSAKVLHISVGGSKIDKISSAISFNLIFSSSVKNFFKFNFFASLTAFLLVLQNTKQHPPSFTQSTTKL